MGFRVSGYGFRVSGQGLGLRVSEFGFRDIRLAPAGRRQRADSSLVPPEPRCAKGGIYVLSVRGRVHPFTYSRHTTEGGGRRQGCLENGHPRIAVGIPISYSASHAAPHGGEG